MRSADTSPEAERVQIELLRRASAARRAQLALSLSNTTLRLAWRAIREANPGATEDEIAVALVAQCYGSTLANRLRTYLEARRR